ncbi:MAG: DUF6657 family protein [Spirochaetaceae bacterium]
MAHIKSAWEIALERTSDIKSDKSSVRANELKREGQKIASEYVNADSPDPKTLSSRLKEYSKEERKEVEKSVFEVLLSQISLPRNNQFKEKLETAKKGLGELTGETKKIGGIVDQIGSFFEQYLQYQEQISEQLKKQYEPQLKKKQEQLSRQYGYSVELRPEQDPEFNQILQSNLEQLEEQYRQALNKARDEIRSITGYDG